RSLMLDGMRARVDLARAQLLLQRYHEAYLTSREMLDPQKGRPPLPVELRVWALSLKARALAGLGRDDRAQEAVDSAKPDLQSLPQTAFETIDARAGLARIELILKYRRCARFPSPEPLGEAQVRDQISRRGLCLLEALPAFRTALAPENPSS